jgi:hypothetical protein
MVLDPRAYHEVNGVGPSLHEHYETELAALNNALRISPLRFSLVSFSLGLLRLHLTSPEISFRFRPTTLLCNTFHPSSSRSLWA